MAVLDTTNGNASISSALGLTAYPFTIAAWVRRTGDHPDTSYFAGLGHGYGSFHGVGVTALEYATFCAQYNNEAAECQTYTGSTVASGSWVPVVYRATSSSLRDIYKGALGNKESDTADIGGFDSGTHPIDTFSLGNFLGASAKRWEGLLAHVAVWNKALSDTEIENFINGDNPLAIANANLLAYWAETFYQDTDWYYQDESGNNYDLLLDSNAVRDTTTAGPTVDAPPATTAPGIVITGIKEPNEVDTVVNGISSARARVWVGNDDTVAADYTLGSQTITDGAMTLTLNTSETISDPFIASVDWDAGGGETKYFRTTGTIVDLDSSA